MFNIIKRFLKKSDPLQNAYADIKRISEEYLHLKKYADLYLEEIEELEETIDCLNKTIDDQAAEIQELRDEINELLEQ